MADDDKVVPFTGKPKDANDLWLGTEEEKKKLLDSISNPLDIIGSNTIEFPGRNDAEEADPLLKTLNIKYAFVCSHFGKPKVMTYMYDETLEKEAVEFISPEDFVTRLCNQTGPGPKGEVIPLGKWWLGQAWRKEYETVTFEPKREPGEYSRMINGEVKYYHNMWEGFSVEPIKGPWNLTLRHIWKILCNKDKEKFKYVIRWLAWAVQNPGQRAEVALIFKGKKGAGKGFIFTIMKKLFGAHGMIISNRDHLVGKFNQHLANKSFLFADEAYHPGDKEAEGVLKQIITEEYIAVEAKFKDTKNGRNCLHIGMSSNEDWVVPVTTDERRFFINEVDSMYSKNGSAHTKSRRYFAALWGEMEQGGMSHMLYYLQNMNLFSWHPRNDIPETRELMNQTYISLPKRYKLILEFIEEGIFPGTIDINSNYTVPVKVLISHLRAIDKTYDKLGNKTIKDVITKLGVVHTRDSSHKYYLFPKLEVLKLQWNKHICKVEWKEPGAEWEVKTEAF